MQSLIRSLLLVLSLAWVTTAQAEADRFGLGNGQFGAGGVTTANTGANDYAAITATLRPGDSVIPVTDATAFRAGTLVMVIQMESLFPAPSAGDPGPFDISTSTTGTFELARIQGLSRTSITLTAPLVHGYTSPGSQILYIPELTSLSISSAGRLLAPAWNGSTGGVLAIVAQGTIQNDGAIYVSGRGARGGIGLVDSSGAMGCTSTSEPSPRGAARGEGIVAGRFGPTDSGRSSSINGGGGGVCFGGGGGGGSNGGHGGRGGRTAEDDGSRNYRSFGGGVLNFSAIDHLSFGGGGGAGHTDSSGALHHGAPGGGVIFIRAAAITGAGVITADGGGVPDGEASGQGGGGAGGTILIRTTGAISCGGLSARGGDGGSLLDGDLLFSPGGGGGGGRVLVQAASLSSGCLPNVDGGQGGTVALPSSYGPSYGSTAGDPGVIEVAPTGPFVIPTPPVITAPTAGAILSAAPTITGRAHAGMTVLVSVDGRAVGSVLAQASGTFSLAPPVLAQGQHLLTAIERAAGVESLPSAPVSFTIEAPGTDTDGDGLTNARERMLGTDPGDVDTDHDGVRDSAELNLGTNPLDADSDDDGIADGEEIAAGVDQFITNPLSRDTDGDGLSDGLETSAIPVTAGHSMGPAHIAFAGTSTSFIVDADSTTHTDPVRVDTDNGSARDGEEDLNHNGRVDAGERDPNLPGDDVLSACGNGAKDPGEGCDDGNRNASDGCSRDCAIEGGWACRGVPSQCSGPTADPDQDHATNSEDLSAGSDPFDADTDLDGLLDGDEIHGTTSAIDSDSDDDALSDGEELTAGADGYITDPVVADSDGDGLPDGLEESELPIAERTTPSGIFVRGTALAFIADADPTTHTNPTEADTDQGGKSDGLEDQNHNGRLDPGETDPLDRSDDVPIDPCALPGSCDAGAPLDAGGPLDVGSPADAGVEPDSGLVLDGGATPDSGERSDAGFAEPAPDAGQAPLALEFPVDATLGGGGCACGDTSRESGNSLGALLGFGLIIWLARRRPRVLPVILAAVLAHNAAAQTALESGDLPAQRFRWAGTSEGILDVEWAGTRADRLFAMSLLFDYARNPLLIRQTTEDGTVLASGPLLRSLLTADVGLVTTLAPALELQAGFSVILFQERPDSLAFASSSVDLSPLSGFGFGDVWVAVKLRLLNRHDHGLDLALIPRMTVPTAGSADYRGEAGVTIIPELALSRAFGPLRLAFNGGVRVRTTSVDFLGLSLSHELSYRFGVGLAPTKAFEIDAALSGNTSLTSPFSDREPSPMEVLLALRFRPIKALDVTVGGGFGLRGGYGAPDARLLAGLRFNVFQDKDKDGDGLIDSEDRCPKKAGPRENQGCPALAPALARVVVLDRDGDGISDPKDQCPDEKEDLDAFQDSDGCPDPDNDQDGLADVSDHCPNQAGPVDNQGCPEPDTDGDGVLDRADNCPTEPGPAENQGCQAKQMVTISSTKLEITEKVFFKTGSAEIDPRSFPLLKNIAQVIVVHPEIQRIRVEGHTDNRGSKAANERLSDRRAKSVMNYLLRQGVEAPRLSAQGLGPNVPIAENKTEEGRSQNRRVEFVIVSGD